MVHDLRIRGGFDIAAIALAPGWTRTKALMENFRLGVHQESELEGNTETPHYAARGVVALARDADALQHTGKVMDVAELARLYDFIDLDGTQSDLNAGRYG